jgi:hypothetical protein
VKEEMKNIMRRRKENEGIGKNRWERTREREYKANAVLVLGSIYSLWRK